MLGGGAAAVCHVRGFFRPVSLTLVSQHTLIAARCIYGRRFNMLPRVPLPSVLSANKQRLITTLRRVKINL